MTTASLTCLILAAGRGTRMKTALPKPLHKVAGRPMVSYAIRAAQALQPEKIVVVVGPGMEQLADAVAPHDTALQAEAKGTGFDTKIMRQVIRMRKLDKADFQEQEAMLDLYLTAMDMR